MIYTYIKGIKYMVDFGEKNTRKHTGEMKLTRIENGRLQESYVIPKNYSFGALLNFIKER